MARIVVIGGSGHVGTYLVPALVERGHAVVNVSRGTAAPYRPHPSWKTIEHVVVDRRAEEAEGKFGSRIAGLNADVVIDMISFELEGTQQLVEALRGKIEHYLFCSSIWVYGHATSVPSTEGDPTNAIDTYGVNKAKIEAWLSQQARRDGFPATCFRPGHIKPEEQSFSSHWLAITRSRFPSTFKSLVVIDAPMLPPTSPAGFYRRPLTQKVEPSILMTKWLKYS